MLSNSLLALDFIGLTLTGIGFIFMLSPTSRIIPVIDKHGEYAVIHNKKFKETYFTHQKGVRLSILGIAIQTLSIIIQIINN